MNYKEEIPQNYHRFALFVGNLMTPIIEDYKKMLSHNLFKICDLLCFHCFFPLKIHGFHAFEVGLFCLWADGRIPLLFIHYLFGLTAAGGKRSRNKLTKYQKDVHFFSYGEGPTKYNQLWCRCPLRLVSVTFGTPGAAWTTHWAIGWKSSRKNFD